MKKIIKIFCILFLLLPEYSKAQGTLVEFVSDTLVKPSGPNKYRLAVVGGGLRIVRQNGNTIPIAGGSTAVNSVNGRIGSFTLTTGDIIENGNQYFTTSRVQQVGDGRYPLLSGSYSNPSWLTAVNFNKLTGTPNSLSGYGIIDAVKTINTIAPSSGNVTLTTANVTENTNLYFTNSRARSAISSGTSSLSYNSGSGVLTLAVTKADVGLTNVDNVADVDKPISSYTQSALSNKADKSTVIPYTTVANYAAAVALSVTGLTIILVTTDEQYTESNALYIKMNSVLYKLVRTTEF